MSGSDVESEAVTEPRGQYSGSLNGLAGTDVFMKIHLGFGGCNYHNQRMHTGFSADNHLCPVCCGCVYTAGASTAHASSKQTRKRKLQ